MSTAKTPAPPAGLGTDGRELWRSIVRDFDLGDDELAVLAAACHTRDELASLQVELVGQPLLIDGHGQVRAHPLLAELRAHRALLARLLKQLDLPAQNDEDDDDELLTAAEHRKRAARKAARDRWDRHH